MKSKVNHSTRDEADIQWAGLSSKAAEMKTNVFITILLFRFRRLSIDVE